MAIGERIKSIRQKRGWSQRDLAAKMNYSNHSTIGKIESGKVDIPQSRIVQFAEVLGVSVAFLMNWEDEQKKNDSLSEIILKLRTDDDFLSVVKKIKELDSEKLKSLLALLQ